MADVRFLRHLRDNDPNKTTLLRGKKVTAAEALQAKLADAKESQSALLTKLNSLKDFGKVNRARTEKSEQAFQWIAEAKRLQEVADAEWSSMLTSFQALAEHTAASEELATEIDGLWCDAQNCSAQWGHDKLLLNASLQQVREFAAALGTRCGAATSSTRGAGVGSWVSARTGPMQRAGNGLGLGVDSGRKVGAAARRTSKATTHGTMELLEYGSSAENTVQATQASEARDTLTEQLRMLQSTRRRHEQDIDELHAAQKTAEAAVDASAKFVAELLAEDREERQKTQDAQLSAMSSITWQGAPQIMQQLFEKICEVDLSFVNDLKLLSQRDEGAALGAGAKEATAVVVQEEVQEEGGGGPGEHAYLLLPEALSEDEEAGENGSGDQRGGTQGWGDSGGFGGRRSSGGRKSVAPGGTELWTSERHARFMKVFKEAHARSDVGKAVGGCAAGGGGAWGLMMRQLQRELPEVGAAALEAYAVSMRRTRALLKQRQALQQTWLQQRDAALQWAVAKLQQLEVQERARLAAKAEAEELDVRRAEVAARLRDLREQRGREDAVRMEEEAAAEAERREQDERQRRREEEERTRAKLAIAAHRERKLEAAEQRLLLRVLLRWRATRAMRETALKNSERVGFRVSEYQRKLDAQRRRREAGDAARAEQDERLRRLRETVAPDVPDDPHRALALTVAAQAYMDGDRETGQRKYAVNDKNFYAGYTMDNLMADTRARLGMALHAAGLHGTSAAREAMMTVKGTLMPRKDMFTSAQLGVGASLLT